MEPNNDSYSMFIGRHVISPYCVHLIFVTKYWCGSVWIFVEAERAQKNNIQGKPWGEIHRPSKEGRSLSATLIDS
jgi:hypothetical protein